ncbi:MAG: hypothetical protein KF688_07015 [Pirellulales bacterium]|nr:hypothetical protein [Pirellulales bacterium]
MHQRLLAALWGCSLVACGLGCAATRSDCCGSGDCAAGRNGRSFAGMKYEACCEQCGGGFGFGGCTSGCCGSSCDSCTDACCDEPCDACAGGECDRCAGDGCACRCRDKKFLGLFSGKWARALCGCSGCSGCGELYWCEWQNDPPACCEPCDCHGNYLGPGDAGYCRAPNAVPELAAIPDPSEPSTR